MEKETYLRAAEAIALCRHTGGGADACIEGL